MLSDPDIDKYLESISIFYDEKVKFLSMKDNYISCNNCPKEKEFIEKYDEIILNCGGGKKDCGVKLNIKFPHYIHYEKDIQKLKKELNEGINLKTINNYIDVSERFEKEKVKKQLIQAKIKDITDRFYQNNIESKKEKIHTFYKSRIEKTKKCKEITTKLKDKKLDNSVKDLLRKEYISLLSLLNKEYKEMDDLMDIFDPYLMVKKPTVTINIKDTSELKDKKKKRSKEKKEAKKKKKAGADSLFYSKGDRIHWIKDNEIIEGYVAVDTTQKKKLIKIINEDDKTFFIPRDQLIAGKHEPEPEPEPGQTTKKEQFKQREINYPDQKEYQWLSTFHIAEPFKYKGVEYPSVENAYQAQKLNDDDPRLKDYNYIFSTYNYKTLSPKEAQEMGEKLFSLKVEGHYTLRKDWDTIKVKVMKEIIKEYYLSNSKYLDKLIKTEGDKLIHTGKNIDDYWGIKGNKGLNNHGKILMELREELA